MYSDRRKDRIFFHCQTRGWENYHRPPTRKKHHKIEQKYRIFTNIHRTPPWIFYLVNFVHACAENFETTDDVWSSRALLWNDVKQILLWDCQQFWIQHVPIWEHPLEYSILSISCMPVQKTLKLLMMFWSNRVLLWNEFNPLNLWPGLKTYDFCWWSPVWAMQVWSYVLQYIDQ